MTSAGVVLAADAAVSVLRQGIDTLLSLDLSRLSTVELTGLVVEVEQQTRRLAAVDHRLIAEVEERRIAGEYARQSTADLLVQLLRVSPAQAKARVVAAEELGPRRALSGESLEPVLPVLAAAVAAGEVSSAHVRVISQTLDAIPGVIAAAAVPVAEAMLVEAARHEHPGALSRTAGMLLARLDPDGTLPRDRDIERRRALRLVDHADGCTDIGGRLTPEVAETWRVIIDALAAPLPAVDGMRDDRTPAQRAHDAFGEAGLRLLRSGTLPQTGGTPVTILARFTVNPNDVSDANSDTGDVTADDAAADSRVGGGTASNGAKAGGADPMVMTGHGALWPWRRLWPLLGDAALVPVRVDADGGLLDCGRTQRLATAKQRLALAARDGGCCFPGCSRPAAWTEVHHIIAWTAGGQTNIDNLCLLCRFHHRVFDDRGWTVEMNNGRPQWTPPAFIDLRRRPIRNTTHHPPDIDFGPYRRATG
jgi:hypothetical protein